MLVQFTSHAYENIMMFEHHAQRLLKLMGQSGHIPGAIKAQDVAIALSHLGQALQKQGGQVSDLKQNNEDEAVSLSQRAYPLMSMLKAANEQQEDILWDYLSS